MKVKKLEGHERIKSLAKEVVEIGINIYRIYFKDDYVELAAWDLDDFLERWKHEYEEYSDDDVLSVELVPDSKWLAKRKVDLASLEFNTFYIENVSEKIRRALQTTDYNLYGLREWDFGGGYNIESGNVFVNNVGYWITDIDLSLYMNGGEWIGIDELINAKIGDLKLPQKLLELI